MLHLSVYLGLATFKRPLSPYSIRVNLTTLRRVRELDNLPSAAQVSKLYASCCARLSLPCASLMWLGFS